MKIKNIRLILDKLNNIGLYPALGVEVEFYILTQVDESFIKEIEDKTGLKLQKEKGYRQYEFATNIFRDIFSLITYVEMIKQKIKDICKKKLVEVSFDPKPFIDDYGSAMHIHISLYNEKHFNIFNSGAKVEDNAILLHSIGGILQLLRDALYMCINDKQSEYDRLISNMMCPQTISWGKNNRTTAIRIPDSPPFNRNRRIEFRVPSASSSLYKCIVFILTSVFYGIVKEIHPDQCVYGDANNLLNNLETFAIDHKSHDNIFNFWKMFKEITSK